MTIKTGDRVLCYGKLEAEVDNSRQAPAGAYRVVFDGSRPDIEWAWVHESHLVRIVPPLAVGDTITADMPEPPIGTTLVNHQGAAAHRWSDGQWGTTFWDLPASWGGLMDLIGRSHSGNWRVAHLPEVTS